ncbi:Major centromere autoantigen B [Dictyocoela muelleri]|nr:Major centromere autoantigen B [Dictyocoela muelleri]
MIFKENKKKTRKRLTMEQKQKIIAYRDKNPHMSHRELSSEFNVPLSTIGDILRASDLILENTDKKTSKKISSNYPSNIFDSKLFEYLISKGKGFAHFKMLI